MAVPLKLIRAHGCHMAILYRNLGKPTEPLPSLQTNKACLFDLSSEGQFRNQAVTGLPDTSYRMRVSEGKRVAQPEIALFSNANGEEQRPPLPC